MMSYLVIKHINIKIIILLITLMYSSRARKPISHSLLNENANFTAIDFLKALKYFQPTYENLLLIKNQNATISSIFYTQIHDMLHEEKHNDRAHNSTNKGFDVLNKISSRTFVKSLMDCLQVPSLQLTEQQSFYLKHNFNDHFLSVVYIDIGAKGIRKTFNMHKGLMDKLSENLLHMTTSKVLFLVNFPITFGADGVTFKTKVNEEVVRGILLKLFHHCWRQRIINVIALLADYQLTTTFYSYTHFPEFKLESKKIAFDSASLEEIYPNRLKDLKGYKLPIVIGGADPRIIPYKTSKGQEVIGGFVGHFITEFARKHNCTLIHPFPFKPHYPLPSKDLAYAVKNGTAEISIGMLNPNTSLTGFTRPVQLLNWCIMLPIEANIPDYKFFTLVFKGNTFILVLMFALTISKVLTVALHCHGYRAHFGDIIFRGDCLRAMLGQPFAEVTNPPKVIRFIYIKICIFGILLTTSYTAHLSTYVTHSPKEPSLKTYDDILRSGLKIVLWEEEYVSMGVSENYKQYTAIFHLVEGYKQFLKIRDSFNKSFGYVIPETKWVIIRQQQKMFTTPLFRISDNLCLARTTPMSFPVHENSPYTPLINNLILESSQSGLLKFWIDYAYLEMIMAKKLRFDDLSGKEKFQAMSFKDLRYVVIFLSCMYVVIFLVFICELLVFYGQQIMQKIRNTYNPESSKNVKKLFTVRYRH